MLKLEKLFLLFLLSNKSIERNIGISLLEFYSNKTVTFQVYAWAGIKKGDEIWPEIFIQ